MADKVATESGPSRPLRKDAARNRDALLQAAREVFAERGLEASLDDVAHHAGLGVGTAYRHFANKYELARAVFAHAVGQIVEVAERGAAAEDPWEGIVAFVEATASAQSSDRGLREVLMGSRDAEQVEQLYERLTRPLQTLVDRAKQRGAVRADAEATDLGVVVMMLCLVADITGDVAPELWRRYLPMLLDGLRPGESLPVPPVSAEQLRDAMTRHKQRMLRIGGRAAAP